MEPLLMLLVLAGIVYGVYSVCMSALGRSKHEKVATGSSGLRKLLTSIIMPNALTKKKGATFMEDKEVSKILNQKNKGLLVDGKSGRMPLVNSFDHCLIVAPIGAGKSTRYVFPNILTQDNCSFIITDPSGELYGQTSGALKAKGFKVQVISPASPETSLCYNPFEGITSYLEVMQTARTLVYSSYDEEPSSKEKFWTEGAVNILSCLMRCLMGAEGKYFNAANLNHLLSMWGKDGSGLIPFFEEYGDVASIKQFKKIISGAEDTVGGWYSNATTALSLLDDPSLSSLLSHNEVNFAKMREEKTALFFIVPSEDIRDYAFIMNMLYKDFFRAMMRELPSDAKSQGRKLLPIFALMDEFGHSAIPNFDTTCTTIRKYEVSISMILQSFAQLESRYGKSGATTIIEGGALNRIFYPGLPLDTAQTVEAMLGKEFVEEYRWDSSIESRERNLLNADRIRTLPDDNAIFFMKNKEAMLIETLPHFRNKAFQKMTRIKDRSPLKPRKLPDCPYVPVKSFTR